MNWQKVFFFSLWGDADCRDEEQEELPFFFPSLHLPLFFPLALDHSLPESPLLPPLCLHSPLFTVSKYERPCIFPHPPPPKVKYKEKKKSKTNHSDASLNLINEAWETWSHNTLVSIKEHKGTDYCQMPLDVSEQRGHTHVILLGLGRHCLFNGCQQSSHSLWLTVLWHHRERRKRYSFFVRSKMENPFSQADS